MDLGPGLVARPVGKRDGPGVQACPATGVGSGEPVGEALGSGLASGLVPGATLVDGCAVARGEPDELVGTEPDPAGDVGVEAPEPHATQADTAHARRHE